MKMKNAFENEIAERHERDYEEFEYELFVKAVDVTMLADGAYLSRVSDGNDENPWTEINSDGISPFNRKSRYKAMLKASNPCKTAY